MAWFLEKIDRALRKYILGANLDPKGHFTKV